MSYIIQNTKVLVIYVNSVLFSWLLCTLIFRVRSESTAKQRFFSIRRWALKKSDRQKVQKNMIFRKNQNFKILFFLKNRKFWFFEKKWFFREKWLFQKKSKKSRNIFQLFFENIFSTGKNQNFSIGFFSNLISWSRRIVSKQF